MIIDPSPLGRGWPATGVFISRSGPGEGLLRRRRQTDAEEAAWYSVRGRKLGAKFRRPCRIENWVVDFYCFEHRLAIELDGGVHSQPSPMRKDAAKEDYWRSLGIGLLRIPNGLMLEDPDEFVRKVREAMGVMMAQVGPR